MLAVNFSMLLFEEVMKYISYVNYSESANKNAIYKIYFLFNQMNILVISHCLVSPCSRINIKVSSYQTFHTKHICY